MRININISDNLHNDLKVRMAIKKQTMKDFIIEAIKAKLTEDKKESLTIQRLEEFVKRQKNNL